jgi:hypothetical protein
MVTKVLPHGIPRLKTTRLTRLACLACLARVDRR